MILGVRKGFIRGVKIAITGVKMVVSGVRKSSVGVSFPITGVSFHRHLISHCFVKSFIEPNPIISFTIFHFPIYRMKPSPFIFQPFNIIHTHLNLIEI